MTDPNFSFFEYSLPYLPANVVGDDHATFLMFILHMFDGIFVVVIDFERFEEKLS
jgi:hypothetical protein